jgi:hypothetical protein
MAVGDCIECAEETTKECNEYEDQGYAACSDWDRDCCDWWPCSWVCEAWTWICRGWYWVTKWVGVGSTWITKVVGVAYEVITVILTPVCVLIDLILMIPILERISDDIDGSIRPRASVLPDWRHEMVIGRRTGELARQR